MSAAGTTSVAPPVVSAADGAKAPGQRSLPWLMSAPAILLCTVMLLVPLVLTFVLSFNAYDAETGPRPVPSRWSITRPC
jgi:putative spermidine/putrescine transport system permease protein